MTVNKDTHSPFVPNLLLTIAGGLEYLRLRRASKNPARTQVTTLRSILEYGKDTYNGSLSLDRSKSFLSQLFV